MKYPITKFKSLAVALQEMEPFVRAGTHLLNGRPFASFGDMRSREAWANWLLCVALNAAADKDFTFTSDPTGSDGIIVDQTTNIGLPTEHIMVREVEEDSDAIEKAIAAAARQKIGKGGAAYASGKNLVVFVEGLGGPWFPNKAARMLPEPIHFESVWVVGLLDVVDGRYRYSVSSLDLHDGNAPTFIVSIPATFDSWVVSAIQ